MNLYEIFDWTWRLSTIGNIIWVVFMVLMGLWYTLGLFVVLTLDSDDTWKETLVNVGTYALIPPLLILTVGYIGYLIS